MITGRDFCLILHKLQKNYRREGPDPLRARRSLVLQVLFYQVDFAAALKLINASLTFAIYFYEPFKGE